LCFCMHLLQMKSDPIISSHVSSFPQLLHFILCLH
jgi:hypothetical protein